MTTASNFMKTMTITITSLLITMSAVCAAGFPEEGQ